MVSCSFHYVCPSLIMIGFDVCQLSAQETTQDSRVKYNLKEEEEGSGINNNAKFRCARKT